MKRPLISISAYYLWTWRFLIVFSVWLCALSEVLPGWVCVGLLGLNGWSLWKLEDKGTTSRPRSVPPPALLLVFATLSIGAGFLEYFYNRDFIMTVGCALAGLLPVLLSRYDQEFGHSVGLMATALLTLIAVIADGNLAQYVILMAFLMTFIFNLNASMLRSIKAEVPPGRRYLSQGHFRQLLLPVVQGLTIGAVIFAVFPRMSSFRNPLGLKQREATTGYTGSINLDGTPIQSESSALAMVVEAEDLEWLTRQGPSLYFRGNTLQKFDGKSWSEDLQEVFPYTANLDVRSARTVSPGFRKIQLYREPHSSRPILFPQVLVGLHGPDYLLGGIRFDRNGNLLRGHSELIRYSYDVTIAEAMPKALLKKISLAEVVASLQQERLDRGKRPPLSYLGQKRLLTHLQLPDSLKEGFFDKWVAEVGISPQMPMQQALDTLSRHFQTSFRARTGRELSEKKAFQEFLTKERTGHCEYFATAAALFLRRQGIPSRVALGYRGGTFNSVSQVLEVRELNAHAWVELYVPGEGWVSYEPTPYSQPEMPSLISLYSTLYWNAARFWFNRYVVNYNSETQRQLAQQMAGFGEWARFAKKFSEGSTPWGKILGALLLFLASAAGVYWRLKRKAPARPGAIPGYYRLLARRLKKHGLERKSHETYAQFHLRVAPQLPPESQAIVRAIDAGFEQEVYGEQVLDPATRGLLEKQAATAKLRR